MYSSRQSVIFPILNFLYLKPTVSTIAAGASFLTSEVFVLLQGANGGGSRFFETAIIVALITGSCLVLNTLIVIVKEWVQRRKIEAQDDDSQHVTFQTRMAELAADGMDDLVRELKELHARELTNLREILEKEVAFWRGQYDLKAKSEHESREDRHKLLSEINRYNNYIFIVHMLINEANLKRFAEIELPVFKIADYESLVTPTVESKTLAERQEKAGISPEVSKIEKID